MPATLCCQKKLISVWMIILKLMAFLRKCTCSRMTNEGRLIIWHMVSTVTGTCFKRGGAQSPEQSSWLNSDFSGSLSSLSYIAWTYFIHMVPLVTWERHHEDLWIICRFKFESTMLFGRAPVSDCTLCKRTHGSACCYPGEDSRSRDWVNYKELLSNWG